MLQLKCKKIIDKQSFCYLRIEYTVFQRIKSISNYVSVRKAKVN